MIWNMIENAKKGRCIILTTHFLDEADVLSDRIGILKDGKLITCGTSLFLKHHFGVGYTLSFNAAEPEDIRSIVSTAEQLATDSPNHHQWRLEHGSEPKFPEVLHALEASNAQNVSLDLTTLEEVFLRTGKEDNDDEVEDSVPVEGERESDADDLEAGLPSTGDSLRQIWQRKGTIRPLGFTRKFLLVQNFMMLNAWKIKGTIALNIVQPLAYLVAGILVSALVPVQDKGERVVSEAITLSTGLAGSTERQFFGVPDVNASIAPLVITEEPNTLIDYFTDLPILGGYYADNATLQYDPEISGFSLQMIILALTNVLTAASGDVSEIATVLQQLPYISDAPYRVDMLVLPMCMGFGFNGGRSVDAVW